MEPRRRKRTISVQLEPQLIADLNRLAAASNMTRHRYMTLLFSREAGTLTHRQKPRPGATLSTKLNYQYVVDEVDEGG
jgi:hypothetical protein